MDRQRWGCRFLGVKKMTFLSKVACAPKRRAVSLALVVPLLLLSGCDDGDSSTNLTLEARNDSIDVNSLIGLVNIPVLDNDLFGNGGRIRSITSPTSNAVVAISSSGDSIDYTPEFGSSGTDQFTYVLTDDSGDSQAGQVTVNYDPLGQINKPPLAVPDAFTIQTDSSNNQLSVISNDIDLDGDTLQLTAASLELSIPTASGESISVDTDNDVINYTPPAGYVGVQTIQYTVSDGQGGTANGVAALTVSPVSLPPVAILDVYNLITNAASTQFDVIANDFDISGSGLTLKSVSLGASLPSNSGSTVGIANNQLVYTPGADYVGVDTVSYEIENGNGQTSTGIATIAVAPLTAPPVALPDIVIVQPETTNNAINPLSNDVDLSGTGLTIDNVTSVLTVPGGNPGTFSNTDTSISYSPAPSFVGVETLSYTAIDGNGATGTGVITISVLGVPSALPPVAVLDAAAVTTGSSNNIIDVVSNDIDPEGNGLTITAVSSITTVPLGATSTVSTDGNTVSYTPGAGFIGVETLSYTVTDSNGASSNGAVTVVVAGLPTGIPPVALPDLVTVNANSSNNLTVLDNDLDTTSSGLTITAISSAGTVPPGREGSLSTDGNTIGYSPDANFSGVETINYTITDGNGVTSSTIATVVISALPLPPVAIPDVATVTTDSSNVTIDVLNNDADISNTGITITSVSSVSTLPIGATSTVSTDGSTLSYTPEASFTGVEILNYEITDGNGNTANSIVTITVSAVVAPPVPLPDLAVVAFESSNNTINALSNDVDLAGGGLTISAVSSLNSLPTGNTGVVSTDGSSISYTPATGFSGAEFLEYEVTDTNGTTATGLVTVTVSPAPLTIGPITLPDTAIVNRDSSANLILVVDNDVDPAGGGLTLTAATVQFDLPVDGNHTVAINNNRVEFTPTAGYAGAVTVSYTVEDSNGNTANGTLAITVNPLPIQIPPIAVGNLGVMGSNETQSFDVVSNDIDPAGGGLTITDASITLELPSSGGGNSVAIVGNQIELTTAALYIGAVTINYEVTDINGNTDTANLAVTVTP